MHPSRFVKCAISSYVVIFLVILGTLSKMTLAAPGGADVPHLSKSAKKFDLDKFTSLALSGLIKAASRLCQWMPQLMKPSSKRLKLNKKLNRSIENDSFFEDFD